MPDEEQELTYVVRIKSFGDLDKSYVRCGKILARICGLNFLQVSIHGRRGEIFRWAPQDKRD